MHEERDRCKELIRELRSTHTLDQESQQKHREEKIYMIESQRLWNEQSIKGDRLREILNSLEGKTVCGTLDFLSKVSFIKSFTLEQFAPFSVLSFPEADEIRGRT